MPSLLVLAVPVYAPLSVWPRQVSTLLAYQSSSLREVIPSPPKEESMPPWESTLAPDINAVRLLADGDAACMKTIGGGTCTIQSKVPIGWVIRTPSIT